MEGKKTKLPKTEAKQQPTLILHVDLNKTILLLDSAKDLSKTSSLMKLLREQAWGRVSEDEQGVKQWKIECNGFSRQAPAPDLVNYQFNY